MDHISPVLDCLVPDNVYQEFSRMRQEMGIVRRRRFGMEPQEVLDHVTKFWANNP